MRLLDRYYQYWDRYDVYEIAQLFKIQIDWIVEAGCHNAEDTETLQEKFKPLQYFAFEPDPTAFKKAQLILASLNIPTIKIFQEGLSNVTEIKYLNYSSEKGDGSTNITDTPGDSVKVVRLDDKLDKNLNTSGLLWLDVEGHTTKALDGMSETLKKLTIAKVEVQLHSRNIDFIQDFRPVINMFMNAGLVPVLGPIHPGYFGDLFFVKLEILGLKWRARSGFLVLQMILLHSYLYPILGKPSPRY